jgi:hypothetical protein
MRKSVLSSGVTKFLQSFHHFHAFSEILVNDKAQRAFVFLGTREKTITSYAYAITQTCVTETN